MMEKLDSLRASERKRSEARGKVSRIVWDEREEKSRENLNVRYIVVRGDKKEKKAARKH